MKKRRVKTVGIASVEEFTLMKFNKFREYMTLLREKYNLQYFLMIK